METLKNVVYVMFLIVLIGTTILLLRQSSENTEQLKAALATVKSIQRNLNEVVE